MDSTDLTKLTEQFAEQISAKIKSEAYSQGWKDAIDSAVHAIGNALEELRPNSLPLFPPKTKSNPFRQGSDMAKLFEFMRGHQGLTGAEIIRGLHHAGVDIEERTARTGLHRMRARGVAFTDEGKWFIS